MLSDKLVHRLLGVIEAPDLSNTRYQLVQEVGRGGMGVVYLALDPTLGRRVALKVLNQPEEARTLAALEHPGIVPVHEMGALPDGRTYYAMKFVEGTRLDEYRASAPSLADRLRVLLRVCEPVAFAHSRGVIHRDLKPENIMIGAFGEVLVLDWGVAGKPHHSGGTVAGTSGYMAPEQFIGQTNPQTDIYSLGKLLQYLLVPADPKPVCAIASKASHPDAAHRYASVLDLACDIERVLDGRPVSAYRESILERGQRLLAQHKTLAVLVLTYLVARVAIFFFARH